jgi:hypothetical protein
MKKLLILAAFLLPVLFAGCASASPQAASAQNAQAFDAPASGGSPAALMLQDSGAVSSQASSEQPEELVRNSVDLDWSRYRLKETGAKTVNGKSYLAFEIWDEDYNVGPLLLADPSDGAVYTWTSMDSAPIPASEDKAFDKTLHTIIGEMQDGAMMSITIRTDEGYQLVVRRLGVDTTGLKSMVVGDRIKVTYTGVIKGSDTTRAFIVKLENDK